jgi:serine/threonine protein kinase
MHRKKIVHRDIKPENILILNKDELQVCFADLGLACMLNDSRNLIIKCGTPGYVDPDVLKGRRFSEKSDIFSLGSLFFNLISGRLLFSGRDA